LLSVDDGVGTVPLGDFTLKDDAVYEIEVEKTEKGKQP